MANNEKKRLIPQGALLRASLIWETWVQTCYNYERMMGMACGHTFLPVIKYLYPDNKEKQIETMSREMEFFNVHHPDLHDPETGEENNYEGEDFDGMFRFEKRMK